MEKNRKTQLDSIWNKSDLWRYIHLVSRSKKSGDDYRKKLEAEFTKRTPHIATNWLAYSSKKVGARVLKEIRNWEEYEDYVKSFSKEIVEVLYDNDIFDSFIAANLPMRQRRA